MAELREALFAEPRVRARATKPMKRPAQEGSGVRVVAKVKRDPVTDEPVTLSEHDPRPER